MRPIHLLHPRIHRHDDLGFCAMAQSGHRQRKATTKPIPACARQTKPARPDSQSHTRESTGMTPTTNRIRRRTSPAAPQGSRAPSAKSFAMFLLRPLMRAVNCPPFTSNRAVMIRCVQQQHGSVNARCMVHTLDHLHTTSVRTACTAARDPGAPANPLRKQCLPERPKSRASRRFSPSRSPRNKPHQIRCDIFTHGGNVHHHFRRLRNDTPHPNYPRHSPYRAPTHTHGATIRGYPHPLKRGSVSGKCCPISPKANARQGISHRVQQHVGIRMTQQTLFIRNGHTADNQRTIFHKACDVKP